MKVSALVLALFASGCGVLGIGPEGRLPEAWVVPVVPIRFVGCVFSGDEYAPRIRELLKEMNARIYDATDGQVRIAKFEVHNGPTWAEQAPGTGNLTDSSDAPTGLGYIGTPRAPGWFFFTLPEIEGALPRCAGIAAHEWFHSWIGLYDEYERPTGSETACPKKWLRRMETDSCLMSSSWRRELCRHGTENHNSSTEQGQKRGMSCYEWLKKVLRDERAVEIGIPDRYLRGPVNPPDPEVQFKG